jgi:hypothetical protein
VVSPTSNLTPLDSKSYHARRENSALLHHVMVAVAHQVEHRIVTPEVAGSRPVGHPIYPMYNQPSMGV